MVVVVVMIVAAMGVGVVAVAVAVVVIAMVAERSIAMVVVVVAVVVVTRHSLTTVGMRLLVEHSRMRAHILSLSLACLCLSLGRSFQEREKELARIPEYEPEHDLVFYSHIHKTSGTSIRYKLLAHLPCPHANTHAQSSGYRPKHMRGILARLSEEGSKGHAGPCAHTIGAVLSCSAKRPGEESFLVHNLGGLDQLCKTRTRQASLSLSLYVQGDNLFCRDSALWRHQ